MCGNNSSDKRAINVSQIEICPTYLPKDRAANKILSFLQKYFEMLLSRVMKFTYILEQTVLYIAFIYELAAFESQV